MSTYIADEQSSLLGNVYLGRVQNVLPSMEAAFIDIGKGRNAVLYAGEVNWDLVGDRNAPRRIENALKPARTPYENQHLPEGDATRERQRCEAVKVRLSLLHAHLDALARDHAHAA